MQGPAFQLSKLHVIRPTGRMAAVVFSALVTTFTWVGPSQAKDISAAQMVSHFNTISLKTGTEVKSRGRVGQTTFKISGDTYRVIARPLKFQDLEFVALAVVRGH